MLHSIYDKTLSSSHEMIAYIKKSTHHNSRLYKYNECHPDCKCNKDLCMNFLMESSNKHKWKVLIKVKINLCKQNC